MAALSQQQSARPAPVSIFRRLERIVRLVTTAISFGLFGLFGLVLALVVFPLLFLFIRDKGKRAAVAQACLHRLFWVYVRVMRAMGTLSFECDHPEILKTLKGTIVVANHPSLLDVVFLMSFMRHTRAVVKSSIWRNPFMRGVVIAANYIPNHGDAAKLMEDCAAALREGANLIIFPEGSRTPDGQPRHYQKGFAHVALLAGAPVQIVTIEVNPPTLRKGESWRRVAPTRARWTIRVHERIDTAGQYGYDRSSSAVRKLKQDVAERIEGLLRA
ncbi:MAG: 1-acyl-sn-glycerol-3-phosphate acyltransferase [Alphaproteobacteria bacterium]|nr:1-acyl-sn-glycerol-3-phosphate acyltransferase [Alphaproteobacteria bacterium]